MRPAVGTRIDGPRRPNRTPGRRGVCGGRNGVKCRPGGTTGRRALAMSDQPKTDPAESRPKLDLHTDPADIDSPEAIAEATAAGANVGRLGRPTAGRGDAT